MSPYSKDDVQDEDDANEKEFQHLQSIFREGGNSRFTPSPSPGIPNAYVSAEVYIPMPSSSNTASGGNVRYAKNLANSVTLPAASNNTFS